MLADILGDITSLLRGIADSTVLDGQRQLAEHGAPPRFVWVVLGATSESGGERNKTISAKTAPELGVDVWQVAVHCWGENLRAAEVLRAAARTAIRKVLDGRRYTIGATESPEVGWATRGHLLVMIAEIRVESPVISLPALLPTTSPLATVRAVGLDGSNAAPGDGVLTSGES